MQTSKARDPRVDPRTDDIIGRRGVSIITHRDTGVTTAVIWSESATKWGTMSIKSWRRWAKGKEVIHRAAD